MTRWFRVVLLCLSLVFFAQQMTAQLNAGTERGLPPNSTFSGGDIDAVDLQNGNLHISIPIATAKQRGGGTLTWKLVYAGPAAAYGGDWKKCAKEGNLIGPILAAAGADEALALSNWGTDGINHDYALRAQVAGCAQVNGW